MFAERRRSLEGLRGRPLVATARFFGLTGMSGTSTAIAYIVGSAGGSMQELLRKKQECGNATSCYPS